MKAELIVEQFDNGITVRWDGLTGEATPESRVALDGNEAEVIGKSIWEDIYEVFDKECTAKVKVTLEYEKL